MMWIVFGFLLLGVANAGYSSRRGPPTKIVPPVSKCGSPTVVKNFDLGQLRGKWYIQKVYSSNTAEKCKCMSAEFIQRDRNSCDVVFTSSSNEGNYHGKLEVPQSGDGHCKAQILTNSGKTFINGQFDIIAFKPNEHFIAYSCEMRGDKCNQYAIYGTKKQKCGKSLIKKCDEEFDSCNSGLKPSELVTVDHSSCEKPSRPSKPQPKYPNC